MKLFASTVKAEMRGPRLVNAFALLAAMFRNQARKAKVWVERMQCKIYRS
jgi:hypothetical protein